MLKENPFNVILQLETHGTHFITSALFFTHVCVHSLFFLWMSGFCWCLWLRCYIYSIVNSQGKAITMNSKSLWPHFFTYSHSENNLSYVWVNTFVLSPVSSLLILKFQNVRVHGWSAGYSNTILHTVLAQLLLMQALPNVLLFTLYIYLWMSFPTNSSGAFMITTQYSIMENGGPHLSSEFSTTTLILKGVCPLRY